MTEQGAILAGLRVVEGSAFVSAPLGGSIMAGMGADVIRFDPIGGGIDHDRWPTTADGAFSLYWAGLNQGKRSVALDVSVTARTRSGGCRSRPLLATMEESR